MALARSYGTELTVAGPALTVIGATLVPMIVGPIVLLICPMAGPTNESTSPQACAVVPPAGPIVVGAVDGQTEGPSAVSGPPTPPPGIPNGVI
jgi:hypothetical protein